MIQPTISPSLPSILELNMNEDIFVRPIIVYPRLASISSVLEAETSDNRRGENRSGPLAMHAESTRRLHGHEAIYFP